MLKISPSILSADFAFLGRDIKKIEKEADYIHFDVMDGVFVPNISIGIPVLKAVKKITNLPLDVHLMIEDPDKYVDEFCNAGADILAVHYEACTHLNRTVNRIKENESKAFVVLNPHTPVEFLTDIIPYVDGVLLMSVNPGFGGQKLIDNIYSRIKRLADLRDNSGYDFDISVDGGVNVENASRLAEAGANILVAGSAVFKSDNPEDTIRKLKRSI